MKRISFSLTQKDISRAMKEVEAYKKWVLEKTSALNERLAVYGAAVASARFSSAWYDEDHRDVEPIDVNPTERGWVISIKGKDVFFIEFGAGVYYNGPEPYPAPRPPEVAKIGEFGDGKGKRSGWYYNDRSEEPRFTRGTPAAMPMWWASKEIQQHLAEIAREVFQ